MEYMTGCYRQKEEETALLLQHYVCGGVPVCLGCICGGEGPGAGIMGGWITGQLMKEFRGFDLSKYAGKKEKFLRSMERQLQCCSEASMKCKDFWMAGIVCEGECFLLFTRGKVRIVLCNTGFGRPALQEIGMKSGVDKQNVWSQRGSMEAGIGILLASGSLYESVSWENIRMCLAVKEIRDSDQTRRRLRELGRAAESRGGRDLAALLLEVR